MVCIVSKKIMSPKYFPRKGSGIASYAGCNNNNIFSDRLIRGLPANNTDLISNEIHVNKI